MNSNGERLFTDCDGDQYSNVCRRMVLPLCSPGGGGGGRLPYGTDGDTRRKF